MAEQSKRQQRKQKRGGKASRPQRRAEKRAAIALGGFNSNSSKTGFKKPGAINHW